MKAHELLPGVHRLVSPFTRWLLGTHRGAVDPDHLQSYLDEFIFSSTGDARQRGLLFFSLPERSVEVGPITFRELVAVPAPTGLPGTLAGMRSWPGTPGCSAP